MSKFFVILQREYAQLVKKKSFLVMTLLTPVMMGAFMLVPSYLARRGSDHLETYAVVDGDGHGVRRQVVQHLSIVRVAGDGELITDASSDIGLDIGDTDQVDGP